jgi:hypothetical protein
VEFLKSVVLAAILSGVVALIVAIISAKTAKKINKDKIALDRELSREKAKADEKLADRRFELDQKLALAKRRAEVAEKVLTDFYAIRHAFDVIRSPMIWAGEMAAEDGVADDIIRNDGYGVMRRVKAHSQQFSELEASRFTALALFGPDAAAPYITIIRAYNRVFAAAESLLRSRNQLDVQHMQNHLREMRRTAFSLGALDDDGEELPDLVKADIEGAIEAIEAICRPALESQLAAQAAGREL